jgi:hypothetical protein
MLFVILRREDRDTIHIRTPRHHHGGARFAPHVAGSDEDGDRWTRINSQDLQGMRGKQRGARKEGNRALQLYYRSPAADIRERRQSLIGGHRGG